MKRSPAGLRARSYHTVLIVLVTTALSQLGAAPVRIMHDVGNAVARYNADGSPDTSFNASGLVAVDAPRQMYANALVIQADGKIVVAGAVSDVNTGNVAFGLARYLSDGGLDPSFGQDGALAARAGDRDAEAQALAAQPDGKLVVAGTAFGPGGLGDQVAVARFTPDGSLDASFGVSGIATIAVGVSSAEGRGLALQPDGKIVVVGTAFFNGPTEDDFAIVRLDADGRLDPSFGGTGVITTDFGSVDPGPQATFDRATAVALEPDGKIVVVGSTGRQGSDFALARHNPDGSLDASFGINGLSRGGVGHHSKAYAVTLAPDGRIVVAGSGSTSDETDDSALVVARYSNNGALDTTFAGTGSVTSSFAGSGSGARSVLVDTDGSVLVGGSGYNEQSTSDVVIGGFAILRYRADGTPDTSFGNAGQVLTTVGDAGGIVNALARWPDGRIVAAGLATFKVSQPR